MKCEQPSCDAVNVDMIRCNICTKYACEQCQNIPVAKLKTIMDKCRTIYFICKRYDEGAVIGKPSNTLLSEDKSIENQNNLVDMLQISMNDSIAKLEIKMEGLIKSQVEEKLKEITNVNETIKKQNETLNQISKSYAQNEKQRKAATKSMDFRQIMQETKNEELIEERQRDARAKNIIIHGLRETPNLAEEKEEDEKVIKELLQTLEIESTPESTTRLGVRDEGKTRPIKIKMRNMNEKELVMSSLGKLKNAPENLKKISVTKDYTVGEREIIRNKAAEAKQNTETEGEGKYMWRVRGTPKNGLRLMKFMVTLTTSRTQLN